MTIFYRMNNEPSLVERTICLMMDEELLNHCLYYKGQEICPVKWKGTVYEHYWGLEAAYTRPPEDSRARYKKYGNDKFHKDFPELTDIIQKLSEEGRGILAYIVDYTYYMQPYTDTKLFLDYGKNRQTEHVEAVPPKVVTKSPLLYYKGGNQNPYKLTEIRSTYWELEYMWVHQVDGKNKIMEDEYVGLFKYDFPDLLNNISADTPLSLKGFMYDQFYHIGGTKYGFPKWFRAYVDSAEEHQ